MSIATDVSRIKGNITAALAAIANKGVTVPDGSTSDALASLIASIEAGGGGGDSEYVIEVGTITFAESFIPNADNPLVIQHSLGKKPILFFATNGQAGYYPKNQICYLFGATKEWSYLRSTYNGYAYSANSGGKDMYGSYANKKIVFSSTDITVGGSNSSGFLSDGTHASTLKWIAVAQK